MIKNIIFNSILISGSILFIGCASNNLDNDNEEIEEYIDNARQNVNWPGTYQGMLPCISGCDGLATMLVLYPDNSFTLRTRKVGIEIKDKIEKGDIQWLENGNEFLLSKKGNDYIFIAGTSQLQVHQNYLSLYSDTNDNQIKLRRTGTVPPPLPTI